MLERGGFWTFYSMRFEVTFPEGQAYLIEPDRHALVCVRNNFKLNKLDGHFFNFFISNNIEKGNIPTTAVDRSLEE